MQARFGINRFFNNLPIRIIGSPLEPFFYASDIAKILGIVNIHTSIVNFDNTEIVTPEMRSEHNITTYKKYKNSMRVDNNIVLLTEYGVYRLIMNSTSPKANEFKIIFHNSINSARIIEETKLVMTPMNDINALEQKIIVLKDEFSDHKNDISAVNDLSSIGLIQCNFIEDGEWLYFICAEQFDGKVKIGRSKHPEIRLKQLQTGNPNTLIVYKTIKFDPKINIEAIAHKYFKDVRIINEWFELTLEYVDIICYELMNNTCE